jgi:hypothetical protein
MRKGILLGAGFSYDLGMPLAAEVTDVFLRIFNKRDTRRFGDLLASQQPYTKDRPINPTAIHAGLDLLLKFKQENGKNYEEYLSRLEAMHGSSTSDQDSRNFLFSVFYDMLYTILVAYQHASFEAMYELNKPWYSNVTNLLSSEETWIFTLNHDLYLECLAIDFGIPITYGDVGNITFPTSNLNHEPIRFSCTEMETISADANGWFSGTRGINLVHLHGGLGELEYKDRVLICNPSLRHSSSSELMSEFKKIESMAYYSRGKKVPSGRDRVVTGPDGDLDILRRAVLTGGNKYSKTMKFRKGEEKLKLFADVLKNLDELTVIGYGFGDAHVNYRISNAMVLNDALKIVIVDPTIRRFPEFLAQFDYDQRARSAACRAAEWMSYVNNQKWDPAQSKALKDSEPIRSIVKRKAEATWPTLRSQ